MKKTFILVHQQARTNALEYIRTCPDGLCVTISEKTRSLEANAAMWPILEAFANQKEICINGRMVHISAEEWKDVLTGLFEQETRMAMIEGRMILLGARTSKYSVKKFSEWMEFLHAMAANMDVELGEYA